MNGEFREDFAVWEPELAGTREDAAVYAANTPKQAAIFYVEEDYRDDPRAPDERILEVERLSDGKRWVAHLEPRTITTWSGVVSVVDRTRKA